MSNLKVRSKDKDYGIVFFDKGEVKSVASDDYNKFPFAFAKQALGFTDDTLIEIVWLTNGKLLLIDEEGKLKFSAGDDIHINQLATAYAWKYGLDKHDVIVGNALLCLDEQVD